MPRPLSKQFHCFSTDECSVSVRQIFHFDFMCNVIQMLIRKKTYSRRSEVLGSSVITNSRVPVQYSTAIGTAPRRVVSSFFLPPSYKRRTRIAQQPHADLLCALQQVERTFSQCLNCVLSILHIISDLRLSCSTMSSEYCI